MLNIGKKLPPSGPGDEPGDTVSSSGAHLDL